MDTVDTVVIGAGHAGLAMSAYLSAGGRRHVVFDRGGVGERWRSERWDSLRLLTPNWMTRLPGYDYDGPDPDGYMTAAELAQLLERYAAALELPVQQETSVRAVHRDGTGFRITTEAGTWQAASVVVATGSADAPRIPAVAAQLPIDIAQLTPSSYRNPGLVAPGSVLVVGASASGVQIADELARDGRDVVLSVGSHTRLPRLYRGMDVMWWLEAVGSLDRSIDTMADVQVAGHEPSLQLVGRPDGDDLDRDLDLGRLADAGVEVVGRLQHITDATAHLAQDLASSTGDAEKRLGRTLDRFDRHADTMRLGPELGNADRPAPVTLPEGRDRIDLLERGIATVVWATGYRRQHGWLHVPAVVDGELQQRYGVSPVPGLYTVGQRFQTRRNSSFIGGSWHDAALVAAHLDALRPIRRSVRLSLRGRS